MNTLCWTSRKQETPIRPLSPTLPGTPINRALTQAYEYLMQPERRERHIARLLINGVVKLLRSALQVLRLWREAELLRSS